MEHQNGIAMRQRIHQAIADLQKRNHRPVTLRELADEVGITSTGHLRYHLERLHDEGIIRYHLGRHGIALLRQPENWP